MFTEQTKDSMIIIKHVEAKQERQEEDLFLLSKYLTDHAAVLDGTEKQIEKLT